MIGIFDSGYGGLTVFQKIDEKFPEYDLIYFGDNARTPYGSRNEKEIFEFTREAVDWLFEQNCELVILACNTASSSALRKIQQEFLPAKWPEKKVLGVLIPVAEEIARECEGSIGILATKATVRSEAYLREIKKLKPETDIIQIAARLLVPLIESDMIYHHKMKEALKLYIEPFEKKAIKNLILGCTHYSLIKDLIQTKLPDVKILDSPSIIPSSLESYLARHTEIEKRLTKNSSRRFVTTGNPKKFFTFAKKFLDIKPDVQRADF